MKKTTTQQLQQNKTKRSIQQKSILQFPRGQRVNTIIIILFFRKSKLVA